MSRIKLNYIKKKLFFTFDLRDLSVLAYRLLDHITQMMIVLFFRINSNQLKNEITHNIENKSHFNIFLTPLKRTPSLNLIKQI